MPRINLQARARSNAFYQFELEIPKGLGSRYSVAGYGERWRAVIIVVAGAPRVGANLETVWESAAESRCVQNRKAYNETSVMSNLQSSVTAVER